MQHLIRFQITGMQGLYMDAIVSAACCAIDVIGTLDTRPTRGSRRMPRR
jgi:hypothetical protein